MIRVLIIAALLQGCLMRVELGGEAVTAATETPENPPGAPVSDKPNPTPAGGTVLRVSDLGIALDRVTPALFTRTQSGDVLLATDDGILTLAAQKHMTDEYHASGPSFARVDGVIAVGDAIFLATNEGAYVCNRGEEKLLCERAKGDEGVVGFAPLPGGRVLFARKDGVGMLRTTMPFFSSPAHVEAQAAFIGTTRSWRWLRHEGSPYACALSKQPTPSTPPNECAAIEQFSAPVTQAVDVDDMTTAFATAGAHVRLRMGQKRITWETPSPQVNDVVVWQGDVWAATEKGLAYYDPKSGSGGVPDVGVLANEPVLALALSDDGGLIAAIGRSPTRLYQLATK